MSIIALFVVFLVSLSANTSWQRNPVDGMKAPYLELVGADSQKVNLAEMQGHYTLVHFWSADDAQSRITANQFDCIAAASERQLNLVSVNIDNNHRLFREIVRLDGLDEATQFYAGSESSAQLVRSYGLSHGLQSFLIAPDGTIVSVNPSAQSLAREFGH